MQRWGKDKDAEKIDENKIVGQIHCELHKGVQEVLRNPPKEGYSVEWIRKWGAKVTLTVTVDEKGGIAPGVTFNTIHPSAITKFYNGNVTTPQTYSLALGFSGSADATRKEAIAFTYAFEDLLKDSPIERDCENETGLLIHSDLKIAEFIANKAFIASIPGSAGGPGAPYSTFSDEITFVVAYGGNLTPTWKLLRFSAGPQGNTPMLSGTRTKTHDIIITLAPVQPDTKPAQLVPDAQIVHQAGLISSQIRAALQGQ